MKLTMTEHKRGEDSVKMKVMREGRNNYERRKIYFTIKRK